MNSIRTTQTVDGIIGSIYRQQERQGERWYIGVIGRVAYQRTIKKLQACSG